MPELLPAGRRPAGDLPQRLGMPQLATQHGDELAPAAETAGVALGLVLPDISLELQPRMPLQDSPENAASSTYCNSRPWLMSVL